MTRDRQRCLFLVFYRMKKMYQNTDKIFKKTSKIFVIQNNEVTLTAA